MTDLATLLPARRPELVLRPLDDGGVVKDPRTSQYFQLQEQEYFLLLLLDTAQPPGAVRTAFEERFGEPLTEEDLDDFLELLAEQGFLLPAGEQPGPVGGASGSGNPKDREGDGRGQGACVRGRLTAV